MILLICKLWNAFINTVYGNTSIVLNTIVFYWKGLLKRIGNNCYKNNNFEIFCISNSESEVSLIAPYSATIPMAADYIKYLSINKKRRDKV